jgi:hypothetical protein
VNGGVDQEVAKPIGRGLGDEDLVYETTPQRRLDEVGTFGEKACGVAASNGTLQLDRRSYPIGLLGQS